MSYRTILTVLASGVLLGAPAGAQQWNSGPVPRVGACFYEQPNFRGRYFCAQAGDDMPAIARDMNDSIRSIRVFGGARLIVYSGDRFNGAERWINYNVPNLEYDGWYERVGSARLSWEPRYADRYDQDRPRGTSGYVDGPRNGRDERGGDSRDGGRAGDSRYGDNNNYRDTRGNAPMTRADAQAIVRSAYEDVFGREPDPASSGWVDHVMNDHWSQQQLENELRKTPEYTSKHR